MTSLTVSPLRQAANYLQALSRHAPQILLHLTVVLNTMAEAQDEARSKPDPYSPTDAEDA